MKRINLLTLASTIASIATLASVAISVTPAHADDDDGGSSGHDYYKRTRGVGVFHQSRLVVGALVGDVADLTTGANGMTTPGATKGVTMGSLAFEAAYLGVPSSFGHFHGIEMSSGVRSGPWDFWLQGGTAVTLFNLGRGGPMSVRLGGGFGAGFDLAHGYAYVRGRAALVLVPDKLDAEASVTWTPPSASTDDYDQRTMRVSVWMRAGKRSRAYEGYVESFHRLADGRDDDREVEGLGAGLGMSFF